MRKPAAACGAYSNNKGGEAVNDAEKLIQGGRTGCSALQYFQQGHGHGHGKGCSCRDVKSCKLLQKWCNSTTYTSNVSGKRRKRRRRAATKLFGEDEEDLIIKLHALLGNRWSLIAGRLPGRTDNEVQNYWNTHVRRKLRSIGIDPDNRRRPHCLSRQHVNPYYCLTDVASSNNSTAQASDAISFSKDNTSAHCHPLLPADLNLDLTLSTVAECSSSPSSSSSSSSALVRCRMLEAAEQQQFDQLKLHEKNEIASPNTLLLFR